MTPGESEPKKRMNFTEQWGGKLALMFAFFHASHDLVSGLLIALLPFIRDDLGLNYLQAGFLVAAFSLTAGFAQLLGGWVSDRLSKARALTIGLAGVGLSAIATAFAPSYYALIVTFIAMGLFSGFYHPSAVSALTNHFESQQRGRVVGLHMFGGTIGFAIGPFLGAIIANSLSWRFAYAFLGIPAIIAAVLVVWQLKLPSMLIRTPEEKTTVKESRSSSIWHVFRSSFGIIALSVAMQLITGPLMSFLSLFLIDAHYLTATMSSMWVTIVRLSGLAGGLIGGWLFDKWGKHKTIFLNLIIFGPAVLLMAKLSFIPLAVALVLFGVMLAMRETIMQTFLMDKSPPHLRATVMGIYFGFGQQGSSIIQPIAGDIMDNIGILSVFNGMAYISVGLSVLAVVMAYIYSRSGAKTKEGLPS